jgi:hypothetical protein
MKKWNLQLFSDLNIEGIDEDILKELSDDTSAEEPQEVQEETPVEADNDNKAVEQPVEEENDDEYQSTGKVPYQRFKAVNEERKTSKARNKELEEQLASLRNEIATLKSKAEPPAQPAKQEVQNDFNAEQNKRIYEIASQRVMKRMNYTQDDVDNLEYSDNKADQAMYNQAILMETQAVINEIREHQAREQAHIQEVTATAKECGEYQAKFNAYPDIQARWDYIANERFLQLPQRKQAILKSAFDRLQNNQGTYQDFDTVSAYFDLANEEWEKKTAPVPTTNNVQKVKQVQALPKAPSVNGGTGADTVYTVERIATIMNSPNGWESLPAEIQKQILEGRLK